MLYQYKKQLIKNTYPYIMHGQKKEAFDKREHNSNQSKYLPLKKFQSICKFFPQK